MSDVARAAAELLQFMPTGSYFGVPLNNLRHALGAACWTPDQDYHAATTQPDPDWIVPKWAWDNHQKPLLSDLLDDRVAYYTTRSDSMAAQGTNYES